MQLNSPPGGGVVRAADALRRIVQALRTSTQIIEKRHRISGAQLFVLQQLSGEDGLSLGQLAARTRTDPSSVSVVVSRLATKGLVLRKRAPEDGRRAMVTISPKGAALLARAPEPAQALLIRALEALPRRRLEGVLVALEEVARRVGAAGQPAPMFFEDAPPAKRGQRGGRGRA